MAKDKDPKLMSHAARMEMLMGLLNRDLNPEACATELLKMFDANEREWNDYLLVRQMVVSRGVKMPPVRSRGGDSDGNGAARSVQPGFDGTIRGLMEVYKGDSSSPYHKTLHATRITYDKNMDRIVREHGSKKVAELDIDQICDEWLSAGALSMAKALLGMLRILINYGAETLKDDACLRLSFQVSNRRLRKQHSLDRPETETEPLTELHAVKIIEEAVKANRPSIAMAQAFMFDARLSQKNVVGEWVPVSEPGVGEVHGSEKWLRGVKWEEIDLDLVLRHETIRGVEVVDLKDKKLIMQEFRRSAPLFGSGNRIMLPASGPIVRHDRHMIPWRPHEFRRVWRNLADAAGVPKNARNKAGADRPDDDGDGSEMDRPAGAARQSAGRN